MKLARLRRFAQELTRSVDSFGVIAVDVIRHWHDSWIRNNDEVITDGPVVSRLTTILGQAEPWREAKSPVVYMPLSLHGCVVEVTFPVVPKTKRTKQVRDQIVAAHRHAMDAFDAEHDVLTGLLNPKAFGEQVLTALAGLGDAASATEIREQAGVVLLECDVDHFKQVNDSYGHPYGDVVLRTCALRLEEVASSFAKETNCRVEVGRAGGEEFVVYVSGAVDTAVAERCGERIRAKIADGALPSEEELATMVEGAPGGPTIPPLLERKISVSVGVSSVVRQADTDLRRTVDRLKNEADAALYRAKSGGRNVVRNFTDILSRYGRIIDVHKDTGVIVADIGGHVGVSVGQEFLVYHPDFCGDMPYVLADGRSRRRLGSYPRMSSARIVSFAVQPDISFCRHVSGREFPIGSYLEAVPMGSIAHLVEQTVGIKASLPLESPAAFINQVADALKRKRPQEIFTVASISVDNVEQIATERGSAFVNDVLAGLYASILRRFTRKTTICQFQPSEFGVFIRGGLPVGIDDILRTIQADMAEKFSDVAVVGAGRASTADEWGSAHYGERGNEHLVEYARYAGNPDAREPGSIAMFSPNVALRVMASKRRAELHERALADYVRFAEIGVKSVDLDNMAALCAWEKPAREPKQAIELFQKALKVDSKPLVWCNLGYVQYMSDEKILAGESFREAAQTSEETLDADVFIVVSSLALMALYVSDSSKVNVELVKKRLKKARDSGKAVRLARDLNDAIELIGGVD